MTKNANGETPAEGRRTRRSSAMRVDDASSAPTRSAPMRKRHKPSSQGDLDGPLHAADGDGAIAAAVTEYPLTHQPQWQRTIEAAIPAIVSIRFSLVSSFDTDVAMASEATGFVVDSKRGLILTNRHVTNSGPFVGEAIFHDHEEVEVFPVYRDPVHDFGFLKFDPSKIRYMTLREIALRPDQAKIGLDIRVVGNDAGEKLSILAGSLSRLDRNAPDYGDLTYNDFNTFYLQASASTSGGSSGSPVLGIDGHAVGLQAGGSERAATDFFFPLDRVKRALELLQQDAPVTRGTIQTQFLHQPFDEVRRLGLRSATEARLRRMFPAAIGLLVVETVVPEGPAAGVLEEGDLLISVNGEHLTQFVPLEDLLDSNIGGELRLEIERGGRPMTVRVHVGDLHAITPDRYVEFGGGRFHNLSYQLARQFCVPVGGVFVAEAGHALRFEGPTSSGGGSGGSGSGAVLIRSVNAQATPDLDAFVRVVRQLDDMERVPVTFVSLFDLHNECVTIATVERHWTPFRMAVRNDATGLFDFVDVGEGSVQKRAGGRGSAKAPQPQTTTLPVLDESLGPARRLLHCMVRVSFLTPVRIEGFPTARRYGAGLVVDAERGIVLTARSTVPFALGDIWLTVADSIHVRAQPLFIHPTQNWTFLQFDTAQITPGVLQAAEFDTTPLTQGANVHFVALNHSGRPVTAQCNVTDVYPVFIPSLPSPRFRATNFESFSLDTPSASLASFGVVTSLDRAERVQGLWMRFLAEQREEKDVEYPLGMVVGELPALVAALRAGTTPELRGLAIEVQPVHVVAARHMGLSDSWAARVEKESVAPQRQLYMVARNEADSPTASQLHDTDLLLVIDDRIVQNVEMVAPHITEREKVAVTVLRHKKPVQLSVPLTRMLGDETTRVVFFAGAAIHAPHMAVRMQSRSLPSRCYVVAKARGSPAYMYGLCQTQWITHINDRPTPDLDRFWAAVRPLKEGEYVRIKIVSFDFVPLVVTVKMNFHYFPTSQLVRDSSSPFGWTSESLS